MRFKQHTREGTSNFGVPVPHRMRSRMSNVPFGFVNVCPLTGLGHFPVYLTSDIMSTLRPPTRPPTDSRKQAYVRHVRPVFRWYAKGEIYTSKPIKFPKNQDVSIKMKGRWFLGGRIGRSLENTGFVGGRNPGRWVDMKSDVGGRSKR